ncbi:cobamide remodeling phosphodiesterase CbiR [Pseudodesulfovibrio sediminis]|uniref:Uncharacterized protein n=1 Tax=Pseudodesulfovibrio sediminis TaxID=2810563 RepID=A0ABM7P572_9BACT|nr:cobamide remodeling phosphodiesterase CbiR [Pseudodesulfovibrio sediminis]BCS87934.1 hypothetical protein PSDVSF_11760 [Pseudodesulfovibrio sediminis]
MPDISKSSPDRNRENSAQTVPVSVADVQKRMGLDFPFTLAAPSFVLPAGVAENSLFLAQYFPEIALLFFEADACLAYTEDDLPPHLSELDCSWHVHMPLDFDWSLGLDVIWRKIEGLIDKAAFLSPRAYVLHPPTAPDMLLPLAARLRDKGVAPASFLIENIRGHSLTPIWEEILAGGFSTCLDIGHILAYSQQDVLNLPHLWETVRMLHVYGEEKKMKHWPLSHLSEEGKSTLRTLLENAPSATVTLEVFNQNGLFASLNQLGQWMSEWSHKK